MIDEDNKSIRDIPFPIDDINYEMDESSEVFEANDEVYPIKEIEDYPEFSNMKSNVNKKAKTIGKLTGIGISSIGILTFFVAIIFSMMANNSFSATITNPSVKVLLNDEKYSSNTISYSFLYTNPYGIGMYCALRDEENNFISKTLVSGLGRFSGVFIDLEYNTDYTFVVYSSQYGSVIYYYESDVLHTPLFKDSDFRLVYKIDGKDDKNVLSYELKYPIDERPYWKDFIFILEPKNDKNHPLSFMENENKEIIFDSSIEEFTLSVSCFDSNKQERKTLAKYVVSLVEG